GVDLPRAVLVVPEVRLADFDLELGDARACVADVQVRAGGFDAAAQFGQVIGEVAHGRQRSGGQRPWQSLYFLPLPQKHGSLRPGVFSTRTGCCWTASGAIGIDASGGSYEPVSAAYSSGSAAIAAMMAPSPCTGSCGALYDTLRIS